MAYRGCHHQVKCIVVYACAKAQTNNNNGFIAVPQAQKVEATEREDPL